MKPKWKDEEIVKLFCLIEKNNKNSISIMQSFKQYAKQCGKNPLTIRNFYYTYIKFLKNDPNLQKRLGIDISKHTTQIFEHFDKKQESELLEKVNNLKNLGYSTRSACMKLSGGNIKQMLRLQNKLQNIKERNSISIKNFAADANSENNTNAKVIKFPKQNKDVKNKLTDDDIKSLFMGLVKLVKENANASEQEKAKKFLEQTEEEKRKRIVELEQKQTEIEILKQQLNELKIKNNNLNKQLEFYRIEYVQKLDNFQKI